MPLESLCSKKCVHTNGHPETEVHKTAWWILISGVETLLVTFPWQKLACGRPAWPLVYTKEHSLLHRNKHGAHERCIVPLSPHCLSTQWPNTRHPTWFVEFACVLCLDFVCLTAGEQAGWKCATWLHCSCALTSLVTFHLGPSQRVTICHVHYILWRSC